MQVVRARIVLVTKPPGEKPPAHESGLTELSGPAGGEAIAPEQNVRSTYLFIVTAIVEVATGLALLAVPSVVISFLLGVDQASPDALVIGRLGGAGLLAIGVECWIAHRDAGSPSQRVLVRGALVYNVGAVAVLAYAGSLLAMAGALLWPGVVLHTGLTAWCLVWLVGTSPGKETTPESLAPRSSH